MDNILLHISPSDIVYSSADTNRIVFDLGRKSVVGNRYVVTDNDLSILFSSPYLIDAMDFASVYLEDYL